ncbi:hypothetical protein ADP8_05098 (plasmid) [Roseomonas mucosa]|nr:hypothetical protein ADP8_05098 [Roseomonas mucosa]
MIQDAMGGMKAGDGRRRDEGSRHDQPIDDAAFDELQCFRWLSPAQCRQRLAEQPSAQDVAPVRRQRVGCEGIEGEHLLGETSDGADRRFCVARKDCAISLDEKQVGDGVEGMARRQTHTGQEVAAPPSSCRLAPDQPAAGYETRLEHLRDLNLLTLQAAVPQRGLEDFVQCRLDAIIGKSLSPIRLRMAVSNVATWRSHSARARSRSSGFSLAISGNTQAAALLMT